MIREKKYKNKFLMRTGAICFGILISIIFLEFSTRIFYTWYHHSERMPHLLIIAQNTNSMGMRDEEHSINKPPNSYRILALGDSFTYGEGIPINKIYIKQLEQLLNSHLKGITVETIIISRPGATTYEEEDFFDKVGFLYNPDCLIIGFCLNDPEFKDDELQKMRSGLMKTDFATVTNPIYKYSYITRFIRERLENVSINNNYIGYYQSLYEDNYRGWQVCKLALFHIADTCQDHNLPVLLVIFPIFSHDMDDNYPFKNLHKKISDYAFSIGIDVLDLLPYYRGMKMEQLALKPFIDPHPNLYAHKIAGKAICEKMLADNYFSMHE